MFFPVPIGSGSGRNLKNWFRCTPTHFQVDALITTNNHHVEVPCEGKKLSDLPPLRPFSTWREFSAGSGISLCLFSSVPPEKSQDKEKFRLVENGLKGPIPLKNNFYRQKIFRKVNVKS
jgi:hypothetical protein